MSGYAAFLRGINVGGHRVVAADLRGPFEALGLRDVTTFRASGNVVFTADDQPPDELTPRVEEGLEAALGYAVPVFLRTEDEVCAIAAHEPFDPGIVEASNGKLQVLMLLKTPPKRAQKEVLAFATDDDRLAFGDRELYWLPAAGTQKSELDFRPIGSLVGLTTARTKGTVQALAAKFFAG